MGGAFDSAEQKRACGMRLANGQGCKICAKLGGDDHRRISFWKLWQKFETSLINVWDRRMEIECPELNEKDGSLESDGKMKGKSCAPNIPGTKRSWEELSSRGQQLHGSVCRTLE